MVRAGQCSAGPVVTKDKEKEESSRKMYAQIYKHKSKNWLTLKLNRDRMAGRHIFIVYTLYLMKCVAVLLYACVIYLNE